MSRLPLDLEAADARSIARNFLREAGFEADGLCRHFGIPSMSCIGDVAWAAGALDRLEPRLRMCVEVFLRGCARPAAAIEAAFGPAVLDAFNALGLLRRSLRVAGALTCPVWLYPVEEFVIASDRRDTPDDPELAPGTDVVFPAIYALTVRFLEFLPEADDRDVLDLCGGTGIGAMVLARRARSSVTSDLAERATHFAEFNARFNQTPVECLRGDLYEAVPGRSFDVVVAHPPFVPEIGERIMFRDGGAAGEDITRRIVEGLPRHLRPGGLAVIVCWARDTQGSSFEERAGEWLGAENDDFDILFGLEKTQSVEEMVQGMRHLRKLSPEDSREFQERLERLQTERFVYGVLMLRRKEEGESGLAAPARVGVARAANAADFQSLFAWRRERRRPDFHARLSRARLALAEDLELVVRHGVRDGALTPLSYTFSTEERFRSGMRVDDWIVPLVTRLTGRSSAEEAYRAWIDSGEAREDFPIDAFLEFIADSVEKGFIHVDLPA